MSRSAKTRSHRKRNTSRTSKTSTARKRVSRGQRAVVPRTIGFALQPRRFTKMMFEGSFTQSVSSVQASFSNIFRVNSIFDPDFAAGSATKNTSVNGWTLANTLYTQYKVHAVAVTVTIQNMSAYNVCGVVTFSNVNAFATGIYPSDMAARNGARVVDLQPLGTDRARGTIKRYVKLNAISGQTKAQFIGDPDTKAVMNLNPMQEAYLAVTTGIVPDGSGFAISSVIKVRIMYYVELFDVIETLAQQH